MMKNFILKRTNISPEGHARQLSSQDGSMRNITVTGVLVADQWEPDGNIADLALLTDDEEKYLLSPGEFGEDFKAVLRKKIKIRGVLTTKAQEKRIRVLDYRPVVPTTSWA
ncbi:hypothetical protein VU01_13332 [Candidatus Electrothrix marina]|uniref:OB-fold nucleic acid binding domain-containing protein n=1 Tax=Candidatus Electrothrix marina TaxID=1859130 RepID=A0A444JB95_9BACT|nr:hypothetical protein VU01_13332 [Candidatus Electrothrix marina]